jgi:hypothetical protein
MTFKFLHRKTVRGIAREMLRCFEDRTRWTVRTLARNHYSVCVDPASSEAVCWCGEGAVVNIAPDRKLQRRFYDAFMSECGMLVWTVNDGVAGYKRLREVLKRLAS